MNRRKAKRLVGTAWLDSEYRIAWETRIMRRRVPLYRAGIAVLRALNAGEPSLDVTRWNRVGPHGGTFVMDKLETMTGRTDRPVTSRAELRARTSFASRLARSISADEWPQIIAEYDRRRRGERPQYHYVGHRPLNAASHALMDEAWVRGELPTDKYRAWNVLKNEDDGAFYSEFFTHGNARGFPGGETNPGFRLGRIMFDVSWRDKATLPLERQILRRSRVLRTKELIKFFRIELRELFRPPDPTSTPPAQNRRDPFTPEVVAAVADFTKPEELRSPTARGETTPDRQRASAIDIANTVQKALPPAATGQSAARRSITVAQPLPPAVSGQAASGRPSVPAQPPPQSHPSHAPQPPEPPPAARPTTRPAHSPRDAQSR
ncbi:hypothetical protein GCM10009630_26560 [Kribbella jejuensis]|uniref:Uncharacterized protein n=1 Tax=Kribbella jejuensis TaxID=236068 RepID=A0A542DUT7_9ACTN|nr:hypothetical protein [Kribbella jejuensis]TQJ06786.1 hypothetical protein FB475_6462 [Kribbella jejuensis]